MKTVVWINFDRDDRHKRGVRHAKTLGNAAWWRKRAKVLEEYTLPSLVRQTAGELDIVGSFLPDVDMKKSLCLRKVLERAGAEWTKAGYQRLVELADADDLLQVLIDSDDMYREDAVARISGGQFKAGDVRYFGNGFTYDIADGRLYRYIVPGGPPPFFALYYPPWALDNLDAFWSYTADSRFRVDGEREWVHHKMNRCRGSKRVGNGFYCGTVNGANTSKEWGNPHFKNHLGREVTGERKAVILARFGVMA